MDYLILYKHENNIVSTSIGSSDYTTVEKFASENNFNDYVIISSEDLPAHLDECDILNNELVIDSSKSYNRSIELVKLNRKNEYPPHTDFLDAWVKNDEIALEEYRQKCLAIKNKYPKPK